MNASYKSSKAQQESLNSYRYEDIRRKQSMPEEEYNPWGKPGGGAPSKQGTGNIRSGIKKYNLLQKKEFEESVDNLNHKSPRSPVYDNLSPRKNNGPFDMDDYEARQQKHNEHMDAIKAQVEEKRRLRKLEKEKQLEEEKKAEERYRKQQELLEQRYEEERIREKEKNEIRKARQQALEEALHKAEEETKKAKFEEQKKKRQQIKPSNDSTSHLSSKQTAEKKRPIKPRKKLMSTYTITVDKGDENIQQQDSSTSADISKFMGTYTLHDPVETFHNNSDSMSDEESYKNVPTTGNDKNYHGHSPKTDHFEDNAARKRHNFRNQANLISSSFLPNSSSESDDNERYATKMQKKTEDGMFSDGSVITEYLPSPTNSPSMRQQKILDQLKNLREGLMRKQMEYLSVH